MKRNGMIIVSLMSCMLIATSVFADLRTKTIRLVPEVNYEIKPQDVSVSVTTKLTDEKIPELVKFLNDYIVEAFGSLNYKVVDSAALKFNMTVDYVDFGNKTKRLLTGGLAGGNGQIEGTIVLTMSGKEVGRFRFSSKLRGGITSGSLKAMGKEVGPPLVLKLNNGERDKELHERPKVKEKK
jgi:hypothetical protein